VSFFPPINPNTGAFRDYPPGPHSGMDAEFDTHVASGSIDGRARTALTLGLLSLVLGVLTGIPAIWIGRKALHRIDVSDGALRGRRVAWSGIALGCVGIGLTTAVYIYLNQHPPS
jgi:hypothetical protein